MACIGHYKSLDKAIRDSLWKEPEKWVVDKQNGRFIAHDDGLRVVKPITTNRWTMCDPIGFITLSRYTHLVISAMIHRELHKG